MGIRGRDFTWGRAGGAALGGTYGYPVRTGVTGWVRPSPDCNVGAMSVTAGNTAGCPWATGWLSVRTPLRFAGDTGQTEPLRDCGVGAAQRGIAAIRPAGRTRIATPGSRSCGLGDGRVLAVGKTDLRPWTEPLPGSGGENDFPRFRCHRARHPQGRHASASPWPRPTCWRRMNVGQVRPNGDKSDQNKLLGHRIDDLQRYNDIGNAETTSERAKKPRVITDSGNCTLTQKSQ